MKHKIILIVLLLVIWVSPISSDDMDNPLYWDLYNFGQDLVYESFKESMNEALTKPFIIANETGKEIQELYIALSSDDDWGKNLWQNEEFFHSGYHIKLSSEDVGPYDIAMVDTDGNVYAKYKVRIIEDLTIKFTQKDRLEK